MIKLKHVHVALSHITRLQGNTVHRLTHSSLVCFEIRSHCVSQATWAWNWCSFCLRITECKDYNCGNLHRLSSFLFLPPALLSPSRLWGEHQLKLPAINEQQGQEGGKQTRMAGQYSGQPTTVSRLLPALGYWFHVVPKSEWFSLI